MGRVTSVNDVRGNSRKLVDRLRLDNTLQLVLIRPEEVRIVLDRSLNEGVVEPLGMDLNYLPHGNSLLVLGFTDGVVSAFNAANADNRIAKGDRIVQVNGLRGPAPDLIKSLQTLKDTKLELVFACVRQ